jgi:hypothetical protein
VYEHRRVLSGRIDIDESGYVSARFILYKSEHHSNVYDQWCILSGRFDERRNVSGRFVLYKPEH